MMFPCEYDRLFSAAGFCHHFEIHFRLEQKLQAFTDHRVIIRNHDAKFRFRHDPLYQLSIFLHISEERAGGLRGMVYPGRQFLPSEAKGEYQSRISVFLCTTETVDGGRQHRRMLFQLPSA